jgi:phospholipid-transporting ATPase
LTNYIFPDFSRKEKSIVLAIIARIGTWILIFTNFVPISLLLTMEMVKYFQGMFISWDYKLYCQESKNPAYVQTSTLNEELGQIQVK